MAIPPIEYQECNLEQDVKDAQVEKSMNRYTRCCSSWVTSLLDTLFWGGKVAPKIIPERVTSTSLALISGSGLLSFPYTVDFIGKNYADICFGLQASHVSVVALSILKIIENTSSLGLISSGFIASLAGLFHNPSIQSAIYQAMIPTGEAALALTIFLNITYIYFIRCKTLPKINEEEITETLAKELIDALMGSEENREASYLAAEVRFSMDKDTLQCLLEKLQEIDSEEPDVKIELLHVVIANMKTQVKINQEGQFALTLIGYILMGIEKYYTPNSLETASINALISWLYTLKITLETIREIRQRATITLLAQDAD